KERTSFKDCKFKDEVNFTKAEFENNDFGNIFCSITFEKKVDFTQFKFNQDINDLTFRDEVIFDNTEFLKEIILSRDNFILEDVNFEECIFDKVDIEDDFLQEKNISFKSCKFKKIIAFRKKNIKNITFGTCTFEQGVYFVSCVFSNVNFYNCNFNNAACFYGSTFNMAPNFSQSVFKDSPNLVNIKAKFDFQNLNTTIENIYKPKDETANDFRDSFRTFKNALIKDNNLLDASNFHKYELYCKELELKFKKLKIFSREWIEKWQLFFYRKLCDHHTDILQSLNSLILVIGIFVLSSVAMVVDFNYRLGYKPILEHLYFSLDFYNHHINSIIQDNYLFVVKVNFAMLFGYLILVGLALCLKCIREFFIIISYVITLLVLAVSPKILIPAMGIFTDKRAMLDPLSIMGGIYTIVFGFVVFSFIKTIRKNSIVPS
ncbi:pentapeptide repeat-containing protein, partial [Campylobacter coli]|nr:pentapeptide repeat-containing protein [Campylobacter coli]